LQGRLQRNKKRRTPDDFAGLICQDAVNLAEVEFVVSKFSPLLRLS